MEKKKILLYGIGTFKNRGVEAIVQTTLKQINLNEYSVTIAFFDLDYNKKFYKKEIKKYVNHYYTSDELNEEDKALETSYQNMPFDYNNFELLYQKVVVKEIEKADICISVGGDNYCYGSCNWLYALDRKAHELGKKLILWGASLFEEITDTSLIENLNNFDLIVIRESLSYNALTKHIPKEKILFLPDPAFSLEPKKINPNKWYQGRKIVVINLSPLTIKDDNQFNAIIELINYILKKTKYSILLLPHVTTPDCNDLEILEKIKELYKSNKRLYLEKENYNCNELKYIISKCSLAIIARTHASIAAYSTLIPTLVIGYSVKSLGIAKDIFKNHKNYVLSNENLTVTNLINSFKYLEANQQEIKKILSKEMPDYQRNAKNIFQQVIEKLTIQDKLTICRKEDCIGCGLCQLKCPHNAITMENDYAGYLYPKIDLSKCIECNICRKSCPIRNNKESSKKELTEKEKNSSEVYGIKNKNLKERENSTSGGAFSVLAKKILDSKGVVYGCEMTDFSARHIRITSYENINRIRGSKYIQSKFNDILEKVKEDLDSDKKVLFSGTPCQIGVLRYYLKKDYENLLLVSVICHGVLNEKLLKAHISTINNKYNNTVLNMNFRNKEQGWLSHTIKYEMDGIERAHTFEEDNLMYLYLKDVMTRESCYRCKYKGKNNQADFILGDYWGINLLHPDFFDDQGVSILTANSKKGKKFLKENKILQETDYLEATFSDIEIHNPMQIKSIKLNKERSLLYSYLKEFNLPYALDRISEDLRKKEANEKLQKEEELVTLLKEENQFIADEIYNMRNSKRWKIIDKTGNIINRILRKNK